MRRFYIVLFAIILLVVSAGYGATRFGGNGLVYVNSARVVNQGHLWFYGGTRFFGKVAIGASAYTLWNVQGFSSFNYGVNKNFEIGISPVFYQDTNSDGGNVLDGQGNAPDDIYVSMKIGSISAEESPFLFGFQFYTRIPTGKEHNIIYEPYSAGTVEVGLTGLVSYFSNTVFPKDGWSVHANIGYLNHNDVGEALTENPNDPKPQAMSSELLAGAGFLYPAGTFDFSLEVNARAFLTKPPVTAYSREYCSYLTMGIYYKPYKWVTFEMGVDMKLLSGEETTDWINTSLKSPPSNFPNYPTWRGLLGVKLAILPTNMYVSEEKVKLEKKAEQQKLLLRRMMDEQINTNNADDELLRIKAERKKVEKELERLRKLLEEDKKKKKKK